MKKYKKITTCLNLNKNIMCIFALEKNKKNKNKKSLGQVAI